MKKLIILLTLVAVSFSADKWEYIYASYSAVDYEAVYVNEKYELEIIGTDRGYCEKYEFNLDGKFAYENNIDPIIRLYENLNLLGADGWELVSTQKEHHKNKNYSQRVLDYHLKRKIGE